MTFIEKVKTLNNKTEVNEAQYNLDRESQIEPCLLVI